MTSFPWKSLGSIVYFTGIIVLLQANDLIAKHFLNKEVEGTIIWCCDQTLWLDVEEQEIYDG